MKFQSMCLSNLDICGNLGILGGLGHACDLKFGTSPLHAG